MPRRVKTIDLTKLSPTCNKVSFEINKLDALHLKIETGEVIRSDTKVELFIMKPNNQLVSETVTTVSGSTVNIDVKNGALNVAGMAIGRIKLSDSDGVVSTAPFYFIINDSFTNDEAIINSVGTEIFENLLNRLEIVENSAQVAQIRANKTDIATLKRIVGDSNSGLVKAVTDNTSQLNDKADKQELEAEKSRIDLLTKIQNGDTNGNTELLDIRIDGNGTEHETAGEATRNVIIKDNTISPNKLNDEYINVLQDIKLYLNKSQMGYNESAVYRVEKSGQTCTELINVNLLGDEITVPLDDTLEGQAFILYDNNKNGYYSKNVSSIKNDADLKDYLIYNSLKKEYTFLVKKYIKNVGGLGYISFNFKGSDKYIKRKADDKELKWLKVTKNNLNNEILLPKHISNSDMLCDYMDFKENTYISSYTADKIIYTSTTSSQYTSSEIDIINLSDEFSFKVSPSLAGQVIVLKNNNNEYYVSLNANLIISKKFGVLEGYINYDESTQIATISVAKMKENRFNCSSIIISVNDLSSTKGYIKNEIKWLNINDNNNSKIEIRLLPEYVLLKGVEYNFYTNQTIMCSRKLDEKYMVTWTYNGAGGTVYNDGIRIKENTVGTKSLRVRIFVEKNGKIELVDTKNAVIRIVENNVVNKNILFIGDSRIEDGSSQWGYRTEIPTMVKSILDNSNTLLGTKGGGSLANHEGRSGWRSYDYCMNETFNGVTNAFYNSSFTDTYKGLTSHFDFSNYMNNNGYSSVDCVAIYLGANDNYNDNSVIYQALMIKSIKNYNQNAKIILFSDYLSPCDNHSLLKSNLNYMTRRSQQMAYYQKQKAMINELGYNDIFIIGSNNVIDDWFDFNRETRKPSYRNTDDELIEYIVDVVHPKKSGYDKIADLICGHINYILS